MLPWYTSSQRCVIGLMLYSTLLRGVTNNILDFTFQFEEKIRKLEEEKDFLRNVVADKENEIEQLIHRIEVMSEVSF